MIIKNIEDKIRLASAVSAGSLVSRRCDLDRHLQLRLPPGTAVQEKYLYPGGQRSRDGLPDRHDGEQAC